MLQIYFHFFERYFHVLENDANNQTLTAKIFSKAARQKPRIFALRFKCNYGVAFAWCGATPFLWA